MKHTMDKMDLSFEVAQRVQIEDVQIIGAMMTRSPDTRRAEIKIEASFTTIPEVHRETNSLNVMIKFVLRGKPEETMAQGLALQIEAVYRLRYKLTSLDGLTEDHYRAFSEMNGVYNAWPYWREFVQSSTSRMGLPVFTLPVMPAMTKQPSVHQPETGKA